jgi:hypothetical protein
MVHSKVKGKHHHMVTINYAFHNLDAAANETPTLTLLNWLIEPCSSFALHDSHLKAFPKDYFFGGNKKTGQ